MSGISWLKLVARVTLITASFCLLVMAPTPASAIGSCLICSREQQACQNDCARLGFESDFCIACQQSVQQCFSNCT
jgi:hypothetical protein